MSKRILICKDREATRNEITLMLGRAGYHVFSVPTFSQAQEHLSGEKPFDAIILGGNLLPGTSGIHNGIPDALEWICVKASQANQEAPIIFYTGYPWAKGVARTYEGLHFVQPNVGGLDELKAKVMELTRIAA
ncbi:MAG: hypothetical protein COY40_03995 [Alphaproteobacteria bacterium CG_4_10_14_0_8_um_filter_53_9]|nr:MAG: hypothetical protein COY40_03995 [Alphaproteobacteria bacterium CG_4_10_14_0_8_um_filter_53_9]